MLQLPNQGQLVGSGAATVEVTIAPSYFDRGARWGWRIAASQDPAVLEDTWPFGQLDYQGLRTQLQAITSDFNSRGALYSSAHTAAIEQAKDAFFLAGVSRDLGISGALLSANGPRTAVVQFSDASTASLYLNAPGTWYFAVATATEQAVEWSEVRSVEVGAIPAPVIPPVVAVPRPQPSLVARVVRSSLPPASPKLRAPAKPAACAGYKWALQRNTALVLRAKKAVKAAKTTRARKAATAKVGRLTGTRARLVVSRTKACRLI